MPNTWGNAIQIARLRRTSLDWQESVKDERNFCTTEPVAPTKGDRYINTQTGFANITGQPVTKDYVYEWNGKAWNWSAPTEGYTTWNELSNFYRMYDGANWVNLGVGVDHLLVLNRGTNTHVQIDSHIADLNIHSPHEHFKASDEANSTTTTSAPNFADKLTLTFTPNYTADYVIMWQAEIANASAGTHVNVRFFDAIGSAELCYSFLEENDAGYYMLCSGYFIKSLTALAPQSFKIQFNREFGGTAWCRRARIFARKIMG